jgi:predicted Abi (CAAX) family protease
VKIKQIWMCIAEGAVRGNSFWTDPVGDLISYVFKSRPWADRIVAIAHNARPSTSFLY